MTNKQVEDAAVLFVIEYEALAGRTAHDVRYTKASGDVESTGRMIEIKAYGKSARGSDLWLEAKQYDEALRNSDYWVYVVDHVNQGDSNRFGLIKLAGPELASLLQLAKEHRTYTVPFPVAVYDQHANEG